MLIFSLLYFTLYFTLSLKCNINLKLKFKKKRETCRPVGPDCPIPCTQHVKLLEYIAHASCSFFSFYTFSSR